MKEFYLIGLTGNLGCGKSTVRRMLEQLGARGIDADLLAHAAMERGTPAWNAIVKAFGADVLRFDGEINRQGLGKRVFGDPDALRRLEEILHPAVGELVKQILRENDRPVVVLEAIKLIESGLDQWCDALWVVTCSPEVEVERVVRDRKVRAEDARARLAAQSSQDEKVRRANVVIDNSGESDKTRDQVAQAWMNTVRPERPRDKSAWLFAFGPTTQQASVPPPPEPVTTAPRQAPAPPPPTVTAAPTSTAVPPTLTPAAPAPKPAPEKPDLAPTTAVPTTPPSAPAATKQAAPPGPRPAPAPQTGKRVDEPVIIQVRPARRGDLEALSKALARYENKKEQLSPAETLKRLGERGYRIALAHGQIVAMAAWEAENLVAITRDIRAESPEIARQALPPLLALIEQDANSLVCEVSVLLVDAQTPPVISELASAARYQPRDLNTLHRLWRQVIAERLRKGETIWAKPLRKELITKPIE